MSWEQFDNLLEQETNSLNSEINRAQKAIDRHDYIRLLFAGGPAERGDQFVRTLAADVSDLLSQINADEGRSRDNQLSLEKLLAAPNGISLNYRLPNGNQLKGNNLTFADIAQATAEPRLTGPGVRESRAPYDRSIANRVESMWSEVEQTDIDAERAIVAELEPQLTQLQSGNLNVQVAALADLNPTAFANLQNNEPSGFLTPEVQEQISAVKGYSPSTRTPGTPERIRTVETPSPVVDSTPTTTRSPNDPRPLFAPAEQQREVFRQQMAGGGRSPGTFSEPTGSSEQTDEDKFQALIELGVDPKTAYDTVYGTTSTGGLGGPRRPSLAEIQAADRAEVEEFLRTQFGGFEFFLNKHASDLQVGLTADGLITAADDPTAVTAKNVLDVIVEQGLTDPGRIEGALSNTKWWQETDAQARVFDVTYTNLNDLERLEFVEPTMDLIREELQFLGAEMSDADRQQLAADLMRLGDESDTETVRDMLIDRLGETFDSGAQSISDFAAARDEIEALSRKYFVPIDTVAAGRFAEEIYLGQRSATEMEQYFKEHALSKFPTLDNAIKNGFTPEEYFAPYKYEIEKMLGRPNISLYDEFADVIEYFPDTGGDAPRPMTMHEVRKYVRGLPEWQQSDAGRASAEALAFAIGKTFGEVA